MDLTAASAEEVNDLTHLPPLDLNKTPRASCKNCGATLAGTERSVGLCPLCQDDEGGGRPHRQRQRQRLMRTTDGRTVTGSYDDTDVDGNSLEDTLQTEADRGGSNNRASANHPVTDIDRVLSNPRKRVRVGPYAGEGRLGNNLTARIDPSNGDRVVRLHDTDIIRHHPNGDVTYNSGGYATPTTRQAIDTWGDPHHTISQSKRLWSVHDRHPDVAHTEHIESQWGGYDRVTGVSHDFHDGMRMGGMSREPDYSNAHPHQAEAAPRGQGIWGSPYPYNHHDRFTQGAGQTVTPTDTRSLVNRMQHPAPPGVRRPSGDDFLSHPPVRTYGPFGEGHGAPGSNYSRERDQRELRAADQEHPDEGYSGFSHFQPDEIHPPVGEFDAHSHLIEHHGYAPDHLGDMSNEHAVRLHDRDHEFGNSLATGDGTPHKHDDPLNDEAPPLPGEHFDDYNKRMNERQVQRMKQRGIEAKVVREVANAALRSDPNLTRRAALVIGHRTVERFPALTAKHEEKP